MDMLNAQYTNGMMLCKGYLIFIVIAFGFPSIRTHHWPPHAPQATEIVLLHTMSAVALYGTLFHIILCMLQIKLNIFISFCSKKKEKITFNTLAFC